MDCFKSMLAYANMQTIFFNFKFKIFKKISVKFIRTSNSVTISICSCACQPIILPIKFASRVPCLLTKFRDFLKPVAVRKTHDIHVGHF